MDTREAYRMFTEKATPMKAAVPSYKAPCTGASQRTRSLDVLMRPSLVGILSERPDPDIRKNPEPGERAACFYPSRPGLDSGRGGLCRMGKAT